MVCWLWGMPDLFDHRKILRCGDLSHLHVPDCIWVFFYFVLIFRRAGLMRSQQDPEMWCSVPFTCAWLYMSFLLFCFDFPACRTYEIATRSWDVVICPIYMCLTQYEFSFILFDLCLFITIFNFILNYVLIVTFWIFTYYKIWIMLIIYCFIWNYWIICFVTCLEVFLECYESTGVSLMWTRRALANKDKIGLVLKKFGLY